MTSISCVEEIRPSSVCASFAGRVNGWYRGARRRGDFLARFASSPASYCSTSSGSAGRIMHAGIHTRRWLSGSSGGAVPHFFLRLPGSPLSGSPPLSHSDSDGSTSYVVSAGFRRPWIPAEARRTSCAGATSRRYSRMLSVEACVREPWIFTINSRRLPSSFPPVSCVSSGVSNTSWSGSPDAPRQSVADSNEERRNARRTMLGHMMVRKRLIMVSLRPHSKCSSQRCASFPRSGLRSHLGGVCV